MGDSSQKQSNILLQLLGNDTHNHNDGLNLHAHGHHHQRRIPSQASIWLTALQHMRLSKALEGIHVSNNAGLLILFLGMGVWLFVVYAVRHHDPLAKEIATGKNKILSVHRQIDERVVSSMKAALPVRMSPDAGTIFVPGSNSSVSVSEEQGLQVNSSPSQPFQDDLDKQNAGSTGPGAAAAARSGPFADARFGSPLNLSGNADILPPDSNLAAPLYPSSYQEGPILSAAPQPQPVPALNTFPGQSSGLVHFGPSNDGSRLKVFVSR
jgi:hypothetical protein